MTAQSSTTGTPGETDQRTRILDAALVLVSELGAAGTSMRRLAAACGLNVATIYHYFPSKADLLRALIGERRYGERMAAEGPSFDRSAGAGDRLAALVVWLAERTLEEEVVLRLIVGEGLRGDVTARRSAGQLVPAIDAAGATRLADGVPELADGGVPTPVAARLVRRTLLAVVLEHLATGEIDLRSTADDLVAALLP